MPVDASLDGRGDHRAEEAGASRFPWLSSQLQSPPIEEVRHEKFSSPMGDCHEEEGISLED
jgi:hypothetical protein